MSLNATVANVLCNLVKKLKPSNFFHPFMRLMPVYLSWLSFTNVLNNNYENFNFLVIELWQNTYYFIISKTDVRVLLYKMLFNYIQRVCKILPFSKEFCKALKIPSTKICKYCWLEKKNCRPLSSHLNLSGTRIFMQFCKISLLMAV